MAAYEAIVMGTSAGGMAALGDLVTAFSSDFSLAIMTVQHMGQDTCDYLVEYLQKRAAIVVKEALDKMPIEAGTMYIAPPGYHLQVERERIFSLSVEREVRHSRPSIDVLFTSAAAVYGERLVGVVLTGANADGSAGLRAIEERGGLAVVQDPATAESPLMPRAALEALGATSASDTPRVHVLALADIGPFLDSLGHG